MPIAQLKPDAEVPNPPKLPTVHKETYRGIIADQNNTAVDALVAYIDGSPWPVDYYGQLIGEHNDIRELDPGQKAAIQQYHKTVGLELRVANGLTPSYDQETAFSSVTGTAIILFLVPNVSDYFVADAGSRNKGLFRITSVERKTFNRDSVYEINYTLIGFIEKQTELFNDIESKVVRTYHFSKDRLIEGISPILQEEVYQISSDLGAKYRAMVVSYFKRFMNRTRMTLVLPQQDKVIYDSRLVDFVYAILESGDSQDFALMRHVSMDQERYLKQPSIWSLLLERDYDSVQRCCQQSKLVPRIFFNRCSWLKGPAFWNFDYYVYPLDIDRSAQLNGNAFPIETDGEMLYPDVTEIPNNTVVVAGETINIIPILFTDHYYVLSEAFYKGTNQQTVLEILVKDYLKHQTLDLKLLQVLLDRYPSWPSLEQFYYGPILFILTKEAIRGFY